MNENSIQEETVKLYLDQAEEVLRTAEEALKLLLSIAEDKGTPEVDSHKALDRVRRLALTARGIGDMVQVLVRTLDMPLA